MLQWLYAISNPAMPSFVKIGLSENYPEALIKDFDLTGCSPLPYRLEYIIFLKDDCYRIVQNIRKVLWIDQKNASHGWYSISGQEAILLIRSEIALFVVDKFRLDIQRHHGSDDFATLMHVMDSVIVLKADSSPYSTAVTHEALEIARIIATILKDNSRMLSGQWVNRVTGNNHRYASSY